jgi:hypothetical protein
MVPLNAVPATSSEAVKLLSSVLIATERLLPGSMPGEEHTLLS